MAGKQKEAKRASRPSLARSMLRAGAESSGNPWRWRSTGLRRTVLGPIEPDQIGNRHTSSMKRLTKAGEVPSEGKGDPLYFRSRLHRLALGPNDHRRPAVI